MGNLLWQLVQTKRVTDSFHKFGYILANRSMNLNLKTMFCSHQSRQTYDDQEPESVVKKISMENSQLKLIGEHNYTKNEFTRIYSFDKKILYEYKSESKKNNEFELQDDHPIVSIHRCKLNRDFV